MGSAVCCSRRAGAFGAHGWHEIRCDSTVPGPRPLIVDCSPSRPCVEMVSRTRLVPHLGRCLLDFVYPPQCPACAGPLETNIILCEVCRTDVGRISQVRCVRCSSPSNTTVDSCPICRDWDAALQRSCVLGNFEGTLRNAVLALKFKHQTELGRECGRRLGSSPEFAELMQQIDVLVPVPLHPARKRERGYNQSDYICLGISEVWNLKVRADLIQRKIQTRQQASLDMESRRRNMKEAFVWKGGARVGASVGLVDDVITTGSTMSSCARILMENGAESVCGLAIATAPRSLDS